MPRNVRNFWIDARIDGRDTKIAGGPIAKDGGLHVTFKQRDTKQVTQALTVDCRVGPDGLLILRVFDADGVPIHEHTTVR